MRFTVDGVGNGNGTPLEVHEQTSGGQYPNSQENEQRPSKFPSPVPPTQAVPVAVALAEDVVEEEMTG